jgi:hypothetical protein
MDGEYRKIRKEKEGIGGKGPRRRTSSLTPEIENGCSWIQLAVLNVAATRLALLFLSSGFVP